MLIREMFNYAVKLIVRDISIFLALFISVTLAVALFSGIIQGVDVVGVAMLKKALTATNVDIVTEAENRNVTKTALWEFERTIGGLEHVRWVERLIRSKPESVQLIKENNSIPFIFVAISSNSSLLNGVSGIDKLEPGKVYVDQGSINATLFQPSDNVTLKIETYNPYGAYANFEPRYSHLIVGGMVELDDRVFSIAVGEDPEMGDLYVLLLRSFLIGTNPSGRRPPHQLMIMSEETLWGVLNSIYNEGRYPTRVLVTEVIIGLDREALVTPWDIPGAEGKVMLITERINSESARYGYVPVNYLGAMLRFVEAESSDMKTSAIIVAIPAFFVAWYIGMTIADISLGLRRREIGLLLTRGMMHKQIFNMFIFESLLVSLLAGGVGIIMGLAILIIIPDQGIQQVIGSISPATIAASFVFSGALSFMVSYKPIKNAIRVNIVDALREYQSDEDGAIGSWQESLFYLILGGYKVVILFLSVSVESFRPSTDNIVVSLLYSVWWGVDYILTFIGPILFFWGITKLLIQHSSWFNYIAGKFAKILVGDKALFLTLSARRNTRRTVASIFMIALVFGYSITVIGNAASTNDFLDRNVRTNIGASASVWLYSNKGAKDIGEKISAMDGVDAITVETWFSAQGIPIRAIDPLRWKEIAYMEPGWLEGANVFEKMNRSDTTAIIEKGAANELGHKLNDTMLIKLGTTVYSLTIVGLFGREPWMDWSVQNPTIYISDVFLENVSDSDITETRILVKLKDGVNWTHFTDSVKVLDPNVNAVDITDELLERTSSNVYLVGSQRVEELGVYFAALMSSFGIALVVSTTMLSRRKELTIMAIRGFSTRQLLMTLLIENLSMVALAILLGAVVGLISLRGNIYLFNSLASASIERRILFPLSAQIGLASVLGLLISSTLVPIIVAVRRASSKPIWSIEE
jgi:hypothetical protein